MIALRGRSTFADLRERLNRSVWLLNDERTLTSQRNGRAFVVANGKKVPQGFGLYVFKDSDQPRGPLDGSAIGIPAALGHLAGGDVISVDQSGRRVRVLWRQRSRQNSILLTERCDHYCLMCSQPPKTRIDDDLLDQAFELVRLLPSATTDIAFTGGEPTLYGEGLIRLIRLCRTLLPMAQVHLLSNGRRFGDASFAAAYAETRNPNMMVGIPIYGAEPALHDYVVQAQGAFEETVLGILNLGTLRQRIELRVVVHKQTAPQLVDIAEFISRNLPFVEQVALMGLEPIGLARANMAELWIDPVDYQRELVEAVRRLDRRRIKTMVYNHQLCVLDRELWRFAVRSISDWKTEYHPACRECSVAQRCGGFFYSAKYGISEHITAISPESAGLEQKFLEVDAADR